MTKVTLFKIHTGFANKPATFELEAHFADETKGDFGAEYALPDGYSLGENFVGRPMIFDVDGSGCEILEHVSGRPQLVSGSKQQPVLDVVG